MRHASYSAATRPTDLPMPAVIVAVDTLVDYYKLLHVQPSAPTAVIKASYRTMLQKLNHHPDRGGDVAFAQLLNAAATTLCNPEARAHYDQLRQQQAAKNELAQKPRQSASAPWGEPGGSPGSNRAKHSDQKRDQTHSTSDSPPSEPDKDRYDSSARSGNTPLLPAKPACPFCRSTYSTQLTTASIPEVYTNTRRCRICNAARTPISQLPESSNDELRRMHRHEHETLAKLWPHWPANTPLESVLTDFSPAGCAVKNPQVLAGGDVIMLETELFNAICNVRYCQYSGQNHYAIGLEFITLDMLARPGTLFIASA